jgi:hypothetical protein
MGTKLCKDCKWMRGIDEFAKCARPNGIKKHELAVLGEPKRSQMQYCSVDRMFGWFGAFVTNGCGLRARFFEPRA